MQNQSITGGSLPSERLRGAPGSPTMAEIRSEVERYLIMGPGNAEVVDLMVAAALSLETERPLWLMIVAPPSSGKTELLKLISRIPGYHHIPSLSVRFLFSGHPQAQGGYMIREVGSKGLLAFPDFTTVLSMNSGARREVFNQLRVIHDGVAGRGTGIDTGGTKIWKGKVAVVACTTNTIERFREHANDLGERFLYFTYQPKVPEYDQFIAMLDSSSARREVQERVKKLVRSKKSVVSQIRISGRDGEELLAIARFVGKARAPVARDGYTREISHVHPSEMPYRVLESLQTLYKCLLATSEGDEARALAVIRSVALSSVPASRIAVLRRLSAGRVMVADLAQAVGLPEITVRRTVEEMEAQLLLERASVEKTRGQSYSLHSDFRPLCATVGISSSSSPA